VGEPSDVRYLQLARILGLPRDTPEGAIKAAAGAAPERLAGALFAEAAASDDVIDAATALQYLDDRLAFFGDILAGAGAVRDAFAERLQAWER
jgi:hypothetical protein